MRLALISPLAHRQPRGNIFGNIFSRRRFETAGAACRAQGERGFAKAPICAGAPPFFALSLAFAIWPAKLVD